MGFMVEGIGVVKLQLLQVDTLITSYPCWRSLLIYLY